MASRRALACELIPQCSNHWLPEISRMEFKVFLSRVAVLCCALLPAVQLQADCVNSVPLKVLANAFPATEIMVDAMSACGNLHAELDTQHHQKVYQALASKPSVYHFTGVDNATLVGLTAQELVRPLDALIKKHGVTFTDNQLIRVDGEVMAIAALVNAQHLMYRADIFDKLNLAPPETIDQVLEVAQRIADAGLVKYPFASTFKAGWNLAEEFINLYLANDGEFFTQDQLLSIDGRTGQRTLEQLKSLTKYMDPEYLIADSTYVARQLQQGDVAIAQLWASRAGSVNDPVQSRYPDLIKMAAAPRGDVRPASTLWWVGWSIAKNTTEEQAEAAFRLIVRSMDDDLVGSHQDKAVWLGSGFVPGESSVGAIKTIEAGAINYPASKRMSILHDALGAGLADYFTDRKSAAETLRDITDDFTQRVLEAGLSQ